MNTTLTANSELITRIDDTETPAPGRWTVAPGHTWLILRPGPARSPPRRRRSARPCPAPSTSPPNQNTAA